MSEPSSDVSEIQAVTAKRRRVLWLVVAVMLVIWLVVLPRIARYPVVRRHIDHNLERQVEADAMFYTEVGPVRGVTIGHRRERVTIGRMRMAPE